MNYLLVMPRMVNKVGDWYMFPLGIPYVSASLKAAGFRLTTLNLNNEDGEVHAILDEVIRREKIDVVLTGGLSVQYAPIRNIVASVKEIDPNIITIVGGGIITSTPEAGMRALEFVDYGVIGEGEITTCEICAALEKNEHVDAVNGLIYKSGSDSYHITQQRAEIENLDSIPFPDYDGFGFEKIMESVPSMLTMDEKNVLVLLGSRSCPFQCTFCFHSSGNKYRQRSLDNIFEELEILLKKYHAKYIYLTDELFSYDMKRVREFCERIKPLGVKWQAQFRVSDITEELVQILKEGNCVTMALGLESADNKILKSMRKHITIEQIERALDIIYKNDIAIQGNFIFGDIEETAETAKNTLEWYQAHMQYGITLTFIVTYPGTYLYKYACEKQIICDEVQFIKSGCPIVNVSKMTEPELVWLSNEITRLSKESLKEPAEIQSKKINYNDLTVDFMGNCIECGAENKWEHIQLFQRSQLLCKQCSRKHRVPFFDEIKWNIERNIEFYLSKYKKIAFWGMTDLFVDLANEASCMGYKEVFFIDRFKTKQGSLIRNKIVYSPDIIKSERIPLIIVAAPFYYVMIRDQISEEYANVKCINITNLIANDNLN